MSESQGRDLKPPEDGMFYENFGFGTFFWYHNFQNAKTALSRICFARTVTSKFREIRFQEQKVPGQK